MIHSEIATILVNFSEFIRIDEDKTEPYEIEDPTEELDELDMDTEIFEQDEPEQGEDFAAILNY
jgi:hypothetical protein